MPAKENLQSGNIAIAGVVRALDFNHHHPATVVVTAKDVAGAPQVRAGLV
jgi:hypothetical protein